MMRTRPPSKRLEPTLETVHVRCTSRYVLLQLGRVSDHIDRLIRIVIWVLFRRYESQE